MKQNPQRNPIMCFLLRKVFSNDIVPKAVGVHVVHTCIMKQIRHKLPSRCSYSSTLRAVDQHVSAMSSVLCVEHLFQMEIAKPKSKGSVVSLM